MTCKRCTHEFCWICLKDWKNHSNCAVYNGSGTGAFDPSAMNLSKTQSEMKHELDRYMHHWNRFANHQQSIKFAEKTRSAVTKRIDKLNNQENVNQKLVSFILDAVDAVIRCKRVLRWTYVFGFYFTGNPNLKLLFESQQSMLEEFTDQLHEFTEKPIQELLEVKVRPELISLTRTVEKYRENLMDAIAKSREQYEKMADESNSSVNSNSEVKNTVKVLESGKGNKGNKKAKQ